MKKKERDAKITLRESEEQRQIFRDDQQIARGERAKFKLARQHDKMRLAALRQSEMQVRTAREQMDQVEAKTKQSEQHELRLSAIKVGRKERVHAQQIRDAAKPDPTHWLTPLLRSESRKPGPASYKIIEKPACIGFKMGQSIALSALDELILRESRKPGPCEYSPKLSNKAPVPIFQPPSSTWQQPPSPGPGEYFQSKTIEEIHVQKGKLKQVIANTGGGQGLEPDLMYRGRSVTPFKELEVD